MKQIKVFIIEDDPMVLDVNQGFLKKLSQYRCVGTATNGEDAYQQIKRMAPDLILLDMYLPDMSGVDLLLKIRDEKIPSDIIMITAARDAKTIHEVLRLGAVDYLVKPFRFERFKAALDTYYKMWSKLQNIDSLKQEDIDGWKVAQIESPAIPKGLSETTLNQIVKGLEQQKEPVTAEQLARALGMARVTVRRYLDYLEKEGKIQVHIRYGTVGRPSHFYSL
ncbi:response regulator [Caldalkalibacillus mannanilyticus]|uniref:response regulator n=1 Tax=Caldalkalibacillus mannanilyticus TaxID=1418 RepID=UPI00046948F0|nr:response regulator [Caldalkalibacillus mannanilyticus]